MAANCSALSLFDKDKNEINCSHSYYVTFIMLDCVVQHSWCHESSMREFVHCDLFAVRNIVVKIV